MEDIKSLKFLLASPEDVLAWSYGEVELPETINYRTLRPEPRGLMCERIFGPTRDFECYCGKYKKPKYKGIVCDKCGVEVTTKKVRRERMGHIKLAAPIVHIWYVYGVPNKLSILLDIPVKKLVSVIYYIQYVVIGVDETARESTIKKIKELRDQKLDEIEKFYAEDLQEIDKRYKEIKDKINSKKTAESEIFKLERELEKVAGERARVKRRIVEEKELAEEEFKQLLTLAKTIKYKDILSEEDVRLFDDYGVRFFDVDMGAEAMRKLLKDLDLEKMRKDLSNQYNLVRGVAEKRLIERKLKYVEGFLKNGTKPEWIVMDVLPVLPADLRPIIALAGGRFATSDLNDLYRRVLNRNNRLKRLIDMGAPETILRNEKRMLQEAVDALFDNEHRFSKPVISRTKVPYKSLTQLLRGKKGRFRRNLLGKRVDYSGRAVIIPDTSLKLNQCGLPKDLALEIFKPFVINKLIERGDAVTIKDAQDLIELKEDIVWDVLEDILKTRTVLLNRPPSLHKYSILAFYPILVEGSAIRINQLVTPGYNADFDGDQMSVFAVLTDEALEETKTKMLPKYNLIKVADGTPIIGFAKDMVIGLYHLTYMDEEYLNSKEEKDIKYFAKPEDAIALYHLDKLDLHEPIYTLINNSEKVLTTVGRIIFNSMLPDDFEFVNKTLDKKAANKILHDVVLHYDIDTVEEFLDNAKLAAFNYATLSGFSLNVLDLTRYEGKEKYVKEGLERQKEIYEQYEMGFMTKEERDRALVELWREVKEKLFNKVWEHLPDDNPLKVQVVSGATGNADQAGQITAMLGIVNDVFGNPVSVPILSSYTEGLNSFEYFISSYGARKGMIDTALNTAHSGYLARKLVDVSQDAIVRMHDCGYDGKGLRVARDQARTVSFKGRLVGRYVTADVVDPKTKKTLIKAGEQIDFDKAKEIEESNVNEVWVRSPMYCKSPLGVCQKCYGYNFGSYKPVEIGTAVGVIAAQSVSEPTTQMTLRSFHSGGAGSSDVVSGVPLLMDLFEMRSPRRPAVLSPMDGKVTIKGRKIILVGNRTYEKSYVLQKDYILNVKDGDTVKKGDIIFEITKGQGIKSPIAGEVKLVGNVLTIKGTVKGQMNIDIPDYAQIVVKDGQEVKRGDRLTDGRIDPKEFAEYFGIEETQRFLLDEMQGIYNEFKIGVHDIHLEIILRQMSKLAKIIDPGDTGLIRGTFINRFLAKARNELLQKENKKPIVFAGKILGVTVTAINAESVLAAMAFQEQVKVLSEAVILGRKDYLRGIKENVIVGHLIPVGEHAIITDISKLDEMQE